MATKKPGEVTLDRFICSHHPAVKALYRTEWEPPHPPPNMAAIAEIANAVRQNSHSVVVLDPSAATVLRLNLNFNINK
jgi:hypothetical protein